MESNLNQIKEALKESNLSDWLEDWDIENLYQQIKQLKPGDIYLEIGVAFGASMSIASAFAPEGVKIFGIDSLDWKDERENRVNNFLNAFLIKDNKREFIFGDSQLEARFWKRGPISLLFIDGDHTYEGTLKDMISWIPWIKSGGIIMFDDYNEKTGVKKAIQDTIENHSAFINHRLDGEIYICQKV